MSEQCGDNRFEIIEKAKKDLFDSTNIGASKKEMKVLDDFLFRCWQMGWLKKYEQHAKEKQKWIEKACEWLEGQMSAYEQFKYLDNFKKEMDE